MNLLLDLINENLTSEERSRYCVEAVEKYAENPEVMEIKNYLDNCEFDEMIDLGIKAALGIPFIQAYVFSKIESKKVEDSLYKIINNSSVLGDFNG